MTNYDPDVVKYALCGAFGRRNNPEDRLHEQKDLTTLFGGLPKKSDIINREESVEDSALSASSSRPRLTPEQRLKQIERQRLNKVFGL